MTMITLDDAMKVLADHEFLDPKWKSNPEDNDYDPADPYPLVRSELEQKSFLCMRTDTEIKTFQSYLASLDPEIIAHHIAAGDLKEWTRYIRVQGTMMLESLLRDNGGK